MGSCWGNNRSSHNYKFSLIIIAVVGLLYMINNIFIKTNIDGNIGIFLKGYFNDLLAPFFILSYSNFLLSFTNKNLYKFSHIVLFCFFCGIVWEFFAPLIKPESVTDILDMICYLIGGILYWVLLKIFKIV